MKIIEQAGLAHRRSRRTCAGSDRKPAAWTAIKASRGFPPYSRCHRVCLPSPVPVTTSCVLAGADCMKKLRSPIAAGGTGRPSTNASIVSRSA